MNNLTKMMLESGLIDEAVVKMLEKQGVLEEGASDLAAKAKLKDATREELINFTDKVEIELDKRRKTRETMLDLNQLRWPTSIDIYSDEGMEWIARSVVCVIDRMGRLYFRPQDVKKSWFKPGFRFQRTENSMMPMETILEVSELYVGDQVAAIQVSTR